MVFNDHTRFLIRPGLFQDIISSRNMDILYYSNNYANKFTICKLVVECISSGKKVLKS